MRNVQLASGIKELVNTVQQPSVRDGNVELLPQDGTVASVHLLIHASFFSQNYKMGKDRETQKTKRQSGYYRASSSPQKY